MRKLAGIGMEFLLGFTWKRMMIVVIFTMLVFAIEVRYLPNIIDAPVVVEHTRGLAIPLVNPDFEKLILQLRKDDTAPIQSLASMALLQIRFDGTIPLWGLLGMVGLFVLAVYRAITELQKQIALLEQKLVQLSGQIAGITSDMKDKKDEADQNDSAVKHLHGWL